MKYLSRVGFGLAALMGLLLLLCVSSSPNPKGRIKALVSRLVFDSIEEQDAEINHHLKQNFMKQKIKAMVVEAENGDIKLDPLPELLAKKTVDKNLWGVNLKQERGARHIVADIEKEKRDSQPQPQTVEQEILQEIAEIEAETQYYKMYKKEFIDSFIENALEAGYAIQLSEDLEVVGIQEARIKPRLYDPETL